MSGTMYNVSGSGWRWHDSAGEVGPGDEDGESGERIVEVDQAESQAAAIDCMYRIQDEG
jgi:hypothetical protein